jgi:GNAT superfamily N-acetyltransferase
MTAVTSMTAAPIVRGVECADVARVERLLGRVSETSRYMRFFTTSVPRDAGVIEHLAALDDARNDAVVAVVDGEVVALASYHVRTNDPLAAEVSVLVDDAWQRRGLGRSLVRRLAAIARMRGVRRFVADVLAVNRAALALMRTMAPDSRAERDGPEVRYVVDLATTRPTTHDLEAARKAAADAARWRPCAARRPVAA